MNDTQVKCFLAVAQHLSFSKASEALHIAQPAVSRYIAKLEQELGFSLFERTSRTVKLTNGGFELINLFRNFYGALENIKANAIRDEAMIQKEIVVGFLDRWDLSPLVAKALQILADNYPNISISLQSLSYRYLQPALENHTIDIMLVMESTVDMSNPALKTKLLVDLPHMLLYSPYTKVARIENPAVEDFSGETFLLSADSVDSVQESIYKLCTTHGFLPKIKNTDSHSSLVSSIASGLGVAHADYWSRERLDKRFLHKVLDSSHSICIAWLDDEDDIMRDAVIDAIVLAVSTMDIPEGE